MTGRELGVRVAEILEELDESEDIDNMRDLPGFPDFAWTEMIRSMRNVRDSLTQEPVRV